MNMNDIKEHMEVIGADGVHVGTVDYVNKGRIVLAKHDGSHGQLKHHRTLPADLVADIEGDRVRLSANGDVAIAIIGSGVVRESD